MRRQAKLRVPIAPEDHAEGPANAPITLVEYGDFECPYCGQAFPIVRQLRRALKSELLLVFRNFPLVQSHPHALAAARAAEAAGLQGRFWEMHTLLFQNQQGLEPDNLMAFAASLGLDLDRFVANMDSAAVEQKIVQDINGGARSGVNGTPTFFVNGARYDGDWSYGVFLETLTALASELG